MEPGRSANPMHRNRAFHVRERDAAYVRARDAFAELKALAETDALPRHELRAALARFLSELETAGEFAHEAVRGLLRGKVQPYREDPHFGILEEERVLSPFLEEMLHNAETLAKRLETYSNLRIYRRRLQRFQTQTPGGSGFLERILQSMEGYMPGEPAEIRQLLEQMEKRYQVGDALMAIVQSMHLGTRRPPGSVPRLFPSA